MRLVLALATVVLLASCGDDDAATPTTSVVTSEPVVEADPDDARFPDVIAATATPDGDGTWSFSVTISSPYDSPDRYADAWRVLGPGGEVLGVRELLHDHAAEQPFTRSLAGVPLDSEIEVVTIEGRDQLNGWGGQTVEVRVVDDG